MNSTPYWTTPAFLCADLPTRITMLQMADGSQTGAYFLQGLEVIDTAWAVAYPGETYQKETLLNNLEMDIIEVVIEGNTFSFYRAPAVWVFKVRAGRADGEIALLDPPCQRRTFLTLPD